MTGFLRETKASILPTFTLALVPIMGMVGAAVDYSRANGIRANLQSALDAAIIAGARDGTSNWVNVALNVFNANSVSKGGLIATPMFTQNQDGSYSGSATAQVSTSFLSVFGTSSISLNAQTKAVTNGSVPGQFCVLVLNATAPSALKLTGNSTIDVTAPQCVLQVNSNSASAISLNGNTSITSADNCFVGSAVTSGSAAISPAPKKCTRMPDPFANYSKPTPGPCNYVNFSASGNNSVTLLPGVYCGGMQFSGQVSVTFSPGTYIIKDGALSATGGSSFTGNGVSFYLTGFGAGIQLGGQANWQITATSDPTTDPLAGFVFFLDPQSANAASSSQLTGSGQMYFEGVIYLPQQQVSLTGGSPSFTPSPYTAYIADTLDIDGNGTLVINNDTSKTSVPIPNALQMALGGRPHLTR